MLAILLVSGCVTQQMVIRTNPPGASVTIDGQALKDPTPVTHPFLWYKTMTIRVERSGYQPVETQERVWTPWWMIFPLDGLWTLLPVPFKDERVFTYTLQRGGGVPPTSSPGATP
jgi:hypothetical protein